uniref:Uncharacterized protein n=1 Tax=Anopheles atroparvus TaxID=41427 RepID=A0AAG5DQH9_ANOAO
MFTCQCLNVSITVNDENFLNTNVTQETLKSDTSVPRRGDATAAAGIADGKSRELASFFKEAIGPLQEANVSVQLTTLLKTIPSDGWDVSKCLNCSCLVFARDPLKRSPTALLVNASLATTAEAVSRRMAQENYSPAYRIMLDGRAADFRGFYRKDEYRSLFNAAANTLDSTNDSNELLEQLRAFMRAETQLANEQIARFTQELNEQLCIMRDRAEQDYLFLTQTFVPELVDNRSGREALSAVTAGGGNGPTMPTMRRTNSGGDRRMDEEENQPGGAEKPAVGGSGPVPAKALAQLMTSVSSASPGGTVVAGAPPGSQMETPPPTPECMPMSTGNSPPSMLAGAGSTESSAMSTGESKQQNSRASSISSNSFASDGHQEAPNGGGLRSTTITRPTLSNSVANSINNNTTNRGAINKPPTQQQQQQHSTSTNLFANHNSSLTTTPGGNPLGSVVVGSAGSLMGANRFSSSSGSGGSNNHMLDSDCLFDIDGMENDKTPPPDTYSDEEDCDYNDTTDNNNQEGGMYIPRYQYRQNSSIARSLPISTPKPMTPFRGNDDDLDEMTEDNVDIAASIKALAKSVHGDAVFGDLPRPQIQRFTSQI